MLNNLTQLPNDGYGQPQRNYSHHNTSRLASINNLPPNISSSGPQPNMAPFLPYSNYDPNTHSVSLPSPIDAMYPLATAGDVPHHGYDYTPNFSHPGVNSQSILRSQFPTNIDCPPSSANMYPYQVNALNTQEGMDRHGYPLSVDCSLAPMNRQTFYPSMTDQFAQYPVRTMDMQDASMAVPQDYGDRNALLDVDFRCNSLLDNDISDPG